MAENTNTEREALMKLADAYADASFDQGLNHRTLDDKPEEAREELEKALSKSLEASASLSLPAAGQEPVAWTGGEEWEQLAWHLCAEENGEESCGELIWEGGPIPEPWGERWLKYEGDAKRMIELVRKFAAPQPAVAAGWMPIETAPKGQLVAVGWLDHEDTERPERFEFDYLDDGCWMQWHEHAEHVEVIGGHGVSYTPPYTHWMPLGTLPPAPSTEGESNGR